MRKRKFLYMLTAISLAGSLTAAPAFASSVSAESDDPGYAANAGNDTEDADDPGYTANADNDTQANDNKTDSKANETTASDSTAAVKTDSFISFGANLNSKEKQTVLKLFGLSSSELANINSITVTNTEEHKYLDAYIPKKEIGTRALSSVYIKPAAKNSGIHVTTKNISYCTSGMYENAMATAGLKDVDVIVAAPYNISGTAALVGATEAYAKMTNQTIDEDKVDAAVDEIVTTGQLEEDNPGYTANAGNDTSSTEEDDPNYTASAGNDTADNSNTNIESMIASLKEKIANGEISTDDLTKAVKEEAEKQNVSLTDNEVQDIVNLMEKISKLDLDKKALSSQADKLEEKVGDSAENTKGFLSNVVNFFINLWSKLFGN